MTVNDYVVGWVERTRETHQPSRWVSRVRSTHPTNTGSVTAKSSTVIYEKYGKII